MTTHVSDQIVDLVLAQLDDELNPTRALDAFATVERWVIELDAGIVTVSPSKAAELRQALGY